MNIFRDCNIKKNRKFIICLTMLGTLAVLHYFEVLIIDLQIGNIRCRDLNARNNESEAIIRLMDQYADVTLQLETLTKQHADLIERVRNSPRFINKSNVFLYHGPLLNGNYSQGSMETYETIRRRIYLITKELWYYLQHKLQSVAYQKLMPGEKRAILDEIAERKSWLVSWQQQLVSSDGYDEWRRKEAASVSDLVQRRLTYLQNPTDCRTAKKLLCHMDACGFGCQLHHLIFCLINAYASERTLVLQSNGWAYNDQGWEGAFYPLSDTCNNTISNEIKKNYRLGKVDPTVVHLTTLGKSTRDGQVHFSPYHFPKDLAKRVGRFNGDPASWWIGQMIKYILRPRQHIQKAINETIAKLGFRSPVVGIHVRRTDKLIWEAKSHDIDEYMSPVGEYFTQLQLTRDVDARRVYIATDEPQVLKNARNKYEQYKFLSNSSVIKSANSQNTRFSPDSLTGLLVDLHLLALSDYVVCTFSSNLCRLVYEMKQANVVDASMNVQSLDDAYYFTPGQPYYRTAVKRNTGRHASVDFEIGDQIKMRYWNVTSTIGTVMAGKNKSGSAPLYKTTRDFTVRSYPEYQQVPIHPTVSDATSN